MRPMSFFRFRDSEKHPVIEGVSVTGSSSDLKNDPTGSKKEEVRDRAMKICEDVRSGKLPREGTVDDCGHISNARGAIVGYSREYAKGYNKAFGNRDN